MLNYKQQVSVSKVTVSVVKVIVLRYDLWNRQNSDEGAFSSSLDSRNLAMDHGVPQSVPRIVRVSQCGFRSLSNQRCVIIRYGNSTRVRVNKLTANMEIVGYDKFSKEVC